MQRQNLTDPQVHPSAVARARDGRPEAFLTAEWQSIIVPQPEHSLESVLTTPPPSVSSRPLVKE